MSVTRKEFQFLEIFILKGNYDIAIIKPTRQGVRKDEGERVLEDINLSLIGGGESRSLHLGIAQIVREAETGRNQIFPP